MSIVKESVLVLAVQWLLVPLSLLTAALVARAVGPEGKGVLLLLAGLSGVLSSLFSLGLPHAAAFLYKQQQYTLSQIMAICAAMAVISTVVATLLFIVWSETLVSLLMGRVEDITVQPIWIWLTLAGLPPALMTTLGDVLLIVDGNMKLYALKNVGGTLVSVALTCWLALILQWGIVGVLWSQLLAYFVPMAVLAYWMSQKKAWSKSGFSWVGVKEMLHVSLQQYGVSLIAMVSKRFDTLLITALLNVREAGYFSIAYALFSQLTNVPRSVMWPLVSRLAARDGTDYTHQLARVSRIQTALMLAIVTMMAVTTPLFIRVFYGEAFLPGAAAVWASLPGIIAGPAIICSNAYFTSKGRPAVAIVPAIVATAMQVAVSLILVPRIGIVGSALGLDALMIVLAVQLLRLTARDANIRLPELVFVSRTDLRLIRDCTTQRLRPWLAACGFRWA